MAFLLNVCGHIHKRFSRKQHFRYEKGNGCSGRQFVNVTKLVAWDIIGRGVPSDVYVF